MFDFIDRLDRKQTLEMLKELDNNYVNITSKIPKPVYDKKGKWKNEKEVKKALKKLALEFEHLWSMNLLIIDKYSKKTLANNYILFEIVRVELEKQDELMALAEWNKVQNKIIKSRQKKIKMRQIIHGNSRRTNKRFNKLVTDMYKNGYSWNDVEKALMKEFNYNSARAKRIAITEKNYYKSEAQLQAIKGLDVYKTWLYSYVAKEPRHDHVLASYQTVRGHDGLFEVGELKALAPQHFGLPEEDINCHCLMRIDLVEDIHLVQRDVIRIINRYIGE